MPKLTSEYFNTIDFQLQGKNHFDVQFTHPGWDKDLTLLVKSVSLPTENTEVNTLDHFNQQIKLAGKTTFSEGNIVIHDAITYDTEKVFRGWRKKVYDAKTGTVGYAANYKCTGTLTEYSPNGEVERVWALEGCWPSTVDYGDLDYESGGYKDISATIVFDWAYRTDED